MAVQLQRSQYLSIPTGMWSRNPLIWENMDVQIGTSKLVTGEIVHALYVPKYILVHFKFQLIWRPTILLPRNNLLEKYNLCSWGFSEHCSVILNYFLSYVFIKMLNVLNMR